MKNKKRGMLQWRNGSLYLSWAIRVTGADQKCQENHSRRGRDKGGVGGVGGGGGGAGGRESERKGGGRR